MIEEGGNFFSLKIFEQGKYYMQSVFMGKSATLWTMRTLEHTVSGVSPKQFFTFREGDTAYTLQRESNSFGQYLSVTELKVGGLRRTIIIPAGKLQQGWRTFGIELRRLLEPSQYVVDALKFVPYRSKQIPKYQLARSYVEAVKALVQARLKHVLQPFSKEKEKVQAGTVKNVVEIPCDNPHTQVVVSEIQARSFPLAAVDGGEGGEGGINGKNKFEEKIPVGNKFNIPLKTNLNSNMVEFGKLSDRRKACWLGRGLTVYVNEYGKRQVSWDSVKGGKQAGKWVISNIAHNKNMGLGPIKPKPCWVIKNPFWQGLSSPSNFEAGESSFSGPRALETSYQNGFITLSSGRSDNIATKDFESLRSTPTTLEHLATSSKVSLGMYSSLAASEVVGNVGEDSTIALA